MAVRAEVACVLTVGERAAGALLHHSLMLTTRLPLTLAATAVIGCWLLIFAVRERTSRRTH